MRTVPIEVYPSALQRKNAEGETCKRVLGTIEYPLLLSLIHILTYYFTYGRAYSDTAKKRMAYIQKLRRQPLGFFSSKESGELIKMCIRDRARAYVVERLGAYHGTWQVGLHFKIPLIDKISRKVSLKEKVIDLSLIHIWHQIPLRCWGW